MRNELGVVTASDSTQDQQAVHVGGHERAEHDLIAEVAQELPQEPWPELL
jgi:hypothetical protein